MAYYPASCDYKCKDCSQNKCGWCIFLDRPTIDYDRPTIDYANKLETTNLCGYSAATIGDKKEG